jgi:hypothetical protein
MADDKVTAPAELSYVLGLAWGATALSTGRS